MIELKINHTKYEINIDPDTPLLWVLRENLNLIGTKFGCGIAQCGACTVHLDGSPIRSCILPVKAAIGKNITTIEGISSSNKLHPVQQAWIDEQVPQCGYCQSGQIMSAVALLNKKTSPTNNEIDIAMRGNICRCGAYPRIKKGIHRASKNLAKSAFKKEEDNK
tara:strand:+ start:31 stop:522 length:492 start_codon:yes stop_codon:yes gene_type:complete